MADLVYVVTIVAFFALMVAFVHLCERIVGGDGATGTGTAEVDTATSESDADHTAPEEVPA